MLELMLTPPRERKAMITSAKSLSFLVLTFLLSVQQDRFAALFLLVHKSVNIIRGRGPRYHLTYARQGEPGIVWRTSVTIRGCRPTLA